MLQAIKNANRETIMRFSVPIDGACCVAPRTGRVDAEVAGRIANPSSRHKKF